MIKKILRYVSYVLIPFAVVTMAAYQYNNYLNKAIVLDYNSALGRNYGVDEMNKGVSILKNNANKGDLMLLGSSELANSDYIAENPANMFPNTDLDSQVCLVGRAGTQSLLDAIKIGAMGEDFKDKKIVFIVSLQWFLDKKIDVNSFRANFSEIQFYKFMNNSKINDSIKKYVCKRTYSLLSGQSSLAAPCFYAYLYSKDNFFFKAAFNAFKPYYYLREKFLDIKDKHESYKAIKKYKDTPEQEIKSIDWEKEYKIAEETGKSECTNNSFYVYDSYYTEYFKHNLDSLKNYYGNVKLCESDELQDYEMAIKLFNDIGVKPYVIIVSTNGYYYDYAGLTREKRLELYDELVSRAKKYNLDYLDLRDYEYTPYFYKDVMHLGWKGWLYLNEEFTKYFS
ncbi:MAG: D-alanyl-lipoteichoic acid biosynthesis protein DltD [Clostridia bacterium]|nr:D-alanyl-lipoteichoic acid biosynthesis protein DltD [Clostridia bacterium]